MLSAINSSYEVIDMFCPGCGKECLDDRNFCNSCGTNLASVKQAMTGQIPPLQPIQVTSDPTLKTKRKLMAAGFFTLGGGIVYSITMAIISEMLLNLNPYASNIVESLIPFCSIFFIIGAMLMIYAKMMLKSVEAQQVIAVQAPRQQIVPPMQHQSPNSFTGYTYPSVTERTTAELKLPQSFKIRE